MDHCLKVISSFRRMPESRDCDNPVIPACAGIQEVKQVGAMEKQPCVYLLASKRNGTLYTGVTSNLIKRAWEHKNNLVECFTSK